MLPGDLRSPSELDRRPRTRHEPRWKIRGGLKKARVKVLVLCMLVSVVYKSWLCSQYFQTSQSSCHQKILCERYCLEVQQSCPFILPDNDDLIHGGTPSFICTGLGGLQPSPDAECCDVRWDSEPDSHSRGTLKWTHPSCEHRNSVTTSGAPRLGHGRLKLCLLVLALLHTVATITAAHNATALVAVFPLEDHAPQEE